MHLEFQFKSETHQHKADVTGSNPVWDTIIIFFKGVNNMLLNLAKKFKMFTRTFKTMFKCVNLLCHNVSLLSI